MLSLPATLTLDEAGAVLASFVPALHGHHDGALEIDASPLQEFDSAAIAVLLECVRQAKSRGKAISVHGAPAKLTELATLYGVRDLIALRPA